MLEDARKLPAGTTIDADICVVGAGPAGMTLAMELAGTRHRVVLLESGGEEFEDATQDLARPARQSGVPTDPVDINRLRFLGGTTGHWNGWSRPLDDLDFETRSWVPHSGWPIRSADLEPFLDKAHKLVQIPEADYAPETWLRRLDPARFRLLPMDPQAFHTIMFLFSPPTRFGTEYRATLEKAANLRTLLHANALEIELDGHGRSVTGLRCATLDGNGFKVRARHVVLATGAIENARLLLNSDRQEQAGVGNRQGLVGRFFMQHPSDRSSRVLPIDRRLPLDFYFDTSVGAQDLIAVLQVSEAEQRRRQILNHTIHTYPIRYRWQGMVETAKSVARAAVMVEFDELAEDMRGVLADLDNMAAPLYLGFEEAGVLDHIALNYRPEQAPNPDSRVTLAAERDALGLRRVEVDWRLNELDLHTLREGHRLLASASARAGIGRLRTRVHDYDEAWLRKVSYLHGGHHHYGTTRMAQDPRQGVVDRNCRVHGLENLWVAGSSVFPTTGIANPTLTIIALALRLAGELKQLQA